MKIPLTILMCMCLLIGLTRRCAAGELRLPAFFSDGMVLQREANVPIWGWAGAGQKVTLQLAGQTASVVADEGGKWRAVLPPLKAGGPLTMKVAGAGNELTVNDVWVGEVWFCSGQSNMNMQVSDAANPREEIREANYPRLRVFQVQAAASPTPKEDVRGRWTPVSPQAAARLPALPYFFGRGLHKELGVPVGLLVSAVGDSSLRTWTSPQALKGEPALKHRALAMEKLIADFDKAMTGPKGSGGLPNPVRSEGGFLYNAMTAPLAGYGIRGGIWYQGEKDVGFYQEYPLCFKTMVADLRRSWGQGDFPFLLVQIATYKGFGEAQASPDPTPNEGTWGFLRDAQTRCLAVPNTAMAVSLDREEFENAHVRNKQAVGERLALAALATAYGKKIVFSGPMYESMKVEGDKIRLRFTHVHGGLVLKGEKGKNGFAVAGADRKFVWADVEVDGQTLLVWSKDVPQPAAVRYAWANFPYFGLSNKEGLPAPTFRTDDWPAGEAR